MSVTQNNKNKKKAIAIVAGVAVFAAVSASAATLGGVTTNGIGANSNDVGSAITDGVNVAFQTSYSVGEGFYVIDDLTVTPTNTNVAIDPEADVRVTVIGDSGVLGEFVSVDGDMTAPGSTIPAADVTRVSVVINGGQVTVGDEDYK